MPEQPDQKIGWWEPAPSPVSAPALADGPIPWRRMLRPRLSRAEMIVSALTLVLGFAVAVSVRTHEQGVDFSGARQEDLVRILDDLDSRANRLRSEVSTLNATRQGLQQDNGDTSKALAEARTRAQQLGILAGTIGAKGPGISLRIEDPRGAVGADVIVDAIEELRDAGAEAIEVSGVRIVAASYVLDGNGGVSVDGTQLRAPYVVKAIGGSETLSRAMKIPGGIVDSIAGRAGASATIEERALITITALQGSPQPQYAATSDPSSSGSPAQSPSSTEESAP